ncbi:MAG: Uma2 family endonuclease [Pseudanabaena sp.]|jgi:Uma2 family endonuclease
MTTLPIRTTQKIIYPDSDGKPMADNTIQFRWIVLIKENLELIFADTADVFVAGDLFWYPVEGHPEICVAPDVMVAFGRAKGDRGSYQQWRENNIAPQVVFEILSPGNRLKEMTKKLQFYDRYGVEEYYIYDPETNELNGLYKNDNRLNVIEDTHNWVSPRLQIRFAIEEGDLKIYRPDGQKFLTTLELNQYAEQEHQRAEQEHQRAEQEYDRAERLLAQLMAMGIQPL